MLGCRAAVGVSVLLAVLSLASCGAGRDRPAARIGGAELGAATVAHWVSVAAGGAARAQDGSLRRRMTEQLIGWRWLTGEAAELGVPVTVEEAERQVARKVREEFAGGAAELERFLRSTGETRTDLRLEAAAELAAARLREAVSRHVRPVTTAEVSEYYSRHRESFAIRERRAVRITNRKSYAAAESVKRAVEAGRVKTTQFPSEDRELPRDLATGARPVLERAIRAAPLHRISGPVKQLAVGTVYDYFVFEPVKVTPASQRTLAQVRGEIARQLAVTAQREALERFVASWRRKWRARTICNPGYVVQKCRNYAGPRAVEPALELK